MIVTMPRGRPSNPGKRCSLTAAEKEMVHERYVNGIIHNPVPHDGATVVGIMVDGLGIILYYIFETLGEAGKSAVSAVSVQTTTMKSTLWRIVKECTRRSRLQL